MDDINYMRMAVDAARKCEPKDEEIHPRVGAVFVRDGQEPITGYRSELKDGEHAEFTALEKKSPNNPVAGATVYTTLEPCTERNLPKIPCVERLIERKISRVFIGMLDPNPKIRGRGITKLRHANIEVVLFPQKLMAEIEEMNWKFIRYHEGKDKISILSPDLIKKNRERTLDEWYKEFNYTYWNRNLQREPSDLFAHLVEVVGGLSLLASGKEKADVNPQNHIAKAIAWWMALCGKVGVKSVENMLWDKFPGICPYCQESPHNPDVCSEKKAENQGVPWDLLSKLQDNDKKPKRIREWQRLFSKIYPAQQTEDYGPSFARLSEELGELAESIRVFKRAPGYFLSEAADVFAWLMHIQNIIESKNQVHSLKRGDALEKSICESYPDGCFDCGKRQCVCPPILDSTIGRIAHEVPTGRGSFEPKGGFMTPDKASEFFLGK